MTVNQSRGGGTQTFRTLEFGRAMDVSNSLHSGVGSSGTRGRGQPGRPRGQARVFAMTRQDALATPDVVTGILDIFG